jgi:glycosyl transferase family 25
MDSSLILNELNPNCRCRTSYSAVKWPDIKRVTSADMTNLSNKLTTHVLNLKRSPERWSFISAHLAEHGIHVTRLEAVDGKELIEKEIAAHYDADSNRSEYFWPLKPSEIGCYMSHRLSMQTFVSTPGADYLLLLEDDIEASELFTKHIDNWLSIVNTTDPTSLKLFTKRPIQGTTVATVQGVKIVRPNRVPLGCVAQLLNKPAAQKLLEFSNPFYRPIDVDYQLWWEHGVDVLCTEISLFQEVSHKLGGTNIGGSGNLSKWDKTKRELVRSWFRTKLSISSHLRRLVTKSAQG